MQRIPHALGNAEQAGAAAVHHSGFLQYVQQFRCMLKAQVHSGNPQVKELLQGLGALGGIYTLAQDGENCTLNRLGHSVVGLVHGACHCCVKCEDIGLFQPGEALCQASEDTGEDDA